MPDLATIIDAARDQLDPLTFRVFMELLDYASNHSPNADGSYSFDLDELAQRLDLDRQ